MFNFNFMEMLLTIPGIVVGFAFHEFAHAYVADRLGDPTPRQHGKLTLDPRVHIDLIGFIFILLFKFGWAKPVITDSRYFKKPRRDNILVSMAGPVMNLLIAIFFSILLKGLLSLNGGALSNNNLITQASTLFFSTIWINIILFVLNLIPIPGLDGFHVLASIIHPRYYHILNFLQQYSMIIFIILIITNITRYIIVLPSRIILNLIMLVLGL